MQTPNEALALELFTAGGTPRAAVMEMHSWLTEQFDSMTRVFRAKNDADERSVVGIRNGRLHQFRAHATGVDHVDWGEVRGIAITARREFFDEPTRAHRVSLYLLEHPRLGRLFVDEARYFSREEHEAFVRDLNHFTGHGPPGSA
jgi:hypothetical protein